MKGSLLVVDDDANVRTALGSALTRDGYEVLLAASVAEARSLISPDLRAAIVDVTMPGGSGLMLLDLLGATPCLFLAEYPSVPQAVAAIKSGAADYLPKPLDLEALRKALKAVLVSPKRPKTEKTVPTDMVAESPGMRAVLATLAQVAPSRATVMVFGESGVGKEVVARAIHAASPRATGPMTAISCAAIPETLLESELFGYERGAFTGAAGAKPGRFETASGGTLFLDEVGEIPLSVQAKLLRVMQEREIERLGALGKTPIDVRVVTATHRDLEAAVAAGTFRLDLLYRLQVVELFVPPLRDRPEDVLPLAERFLAKFAAENGRTPLAVPPRILARMQAHLWPGNVRELENAMERATVLAPATATEVELGWLGAPLRLAA
ncbi:sigma-54-dependent Fis family transcriptional regulator [bacterium]|nr:MAG: sigma-54-dependent Fis family transcriptional regulator [bacterium]